MTARPAKTGMLPITSSAATMKPQTKTGTGLAIVARTDAGAGREAIELAWDEPAFELPLPVAIAGEERRVEMPGGRARLEVAAGAEVAVDPRGWTLAEPAAGCS